MQPSNRRFVPAFIAAVVLSASSAFVSTAGAAEPALVVNLAGKFKPYGPNIPGCEHILLKGDLANKPSQHVCRMAKGFVYLGVDVPDSFNVVEEKQ